MCNYGVAKKKLHSVQGVDQRGKDSTPWKTNHDSLVKAFVQGDCHDTHCEIWKCELISLGISLIHNTKHQLSQRKHEFSAVQTCSQSLVHVVVAFTAELAALCRHTSTLQLSWPLWRESREMIKVLLQLPQWCLGFRETISSHQDLLLNTTLPHTHRHQGFQLLASHVHYLWCEACLSSYSHVATCSELHELYRQVTCS